MIYRQKSHYNQDVFETDSPREKNAIHRKAKMRQRCSSAF